MIPPALTPCHICGAIGWLHRRSCVLWTPTEGEMHDRGSEGTGGAVWMAILGIVVMLAVMLWGRQ